MRLYAAGIAIFRFGCGALTGSIRPAPRLDIRYAAQNPKVADTVPPTRPSPVLPLTPAET